MMIDTKALREKVLDLAIHGKLVTQNSNDEPASVLLQRIHTEKRQMVKDGKLKPKEIKNDTIIFKDDDNLHYEQFQNGTVKCIENEIPFDVPDSWCWCRLQTICPYGDCTKIDSCNIKNDERILELEDIEKDTGKILKFVTKEHRNSVSVKHKFFKGQLLYSILRPYLNKVVIADSDGYCTTEILPLSLFGSILPEYMQIFLMSNVFLNYVNKISYGVKMPRLGTNDGKRALIALPPLNEQKKIVGVYNVAKSYIDLLEYESKSLLNTATTLKSKILNLAIRGKLVPQNPNDEPASVLLERIKKEKEELIKQGKSKRNKKESFVFKSEDNSYYEKSGNGVTCIDDEIPFELPDSWLWMRMKSVGKWKLGDTPSRSHPEYFGGDIPWIKTGDLNNDYIFETSEKISTEAVLNSSAKIIPKDTVLIAMYGTTIGKVGITTCDSATNQSCCACCNPIFVVPKYLFYYLQSQKENFVNKAIGGTQLNISKEKIVESFIPIPPILEQHRIIEAIENAEKLIDNIIKL